MVRDGFLLGNLQNPTRCLVRKGEGHEIMPSILQSGKAVSEIDPDWFVVRVADGAPKKGRTEHHHCFKLSSIRH
jgi:hypothetical protein